MKSLLTRVYSRDVGIKGTETPADSSHNTHDQGDQTDQLNPKKEWQV